MEIKTLAERDDKELLRAAITTSVPKVPAQFDEVEWKFVSVPARHGRALEPDTMLVTGIRGAGKSFWWYLLQQEKYRKILLGNRVSISVGFGQGSDARWPGRDELSQLLVLEYKPRLIWKAVVLRQIAPQKVPSGDWAELVNWVVQNPSPIATLFREFDAELEHKNKSHIVLFDALDCTADVRADQELLLSGLLQLVLELRSYKRLRAKVFARPDMLDAPEVKSFTDASKVLASGAKLEWSTLDLYALLFQYLGNAEDDAAAKKFRSLAGAPLEAGKQIWRVPKLLYHSETQQRRIFGKIAGPYMGTNARRGRTYTWIPNHLSDALDNVSPRSFLAAIRKAAEEPSRHEYPLHWSGLHEGVRHASEIRVNEIQEDLRWAHSAMQLLKDQVVPCSQETILSVWQKGGLWSQKRKDLPENPEVVIKNLRQMGIFKELADGRINIPDVYRLGFGLRRKGGFAPRR